jgi:hypothetical protein
LRMRYRLPNAIAMVEEWPILSSGDSHHHSNISRKEYRKRPGYCECQCWTET